MPRIWHAAQNDRNVRVLGWLKYSMARRYAKAAREGTPAPRGFFAMKRIRVASAPISSSCSGRTAAEVST